MGTRECDEAAAQEGVTGSTPPPSANQCFSLTGTNSAMPFSVQGLVLGAPEACSQTPSSQPSRGLLPCTAQQPQPQPPQQPPPQPQGLPPAAQQQPAMSNHMISQVRCCTLPRAQQTPWAHRLGLEAEPGYTRGALDSHLPGTGFECPHACCLSGSDRPSVLLPESRRRSGASLCDISTCQPLLSLFRPPGKGSVALG